jgi:hypothetical protein
MADTSAGAVTPTAMPGLPKGANGALTGVDTKFDEPAPKPGAAPSGTIPRLKA